MSSSRRARWSSKSVPDTDSVGACDRLAVAQLLQRAADQAGLGALGAIDGIAEALVEAARRLVRFQHPQGHGGAFARGRLAQGMLAERPAGAETPALGTHVDGE